MRFDEIIPLTGALVNFSLAILVLVENPRATVGRVYFFLGICFAVWNYGTFWMFRLDTYEDALFASRFIQFGENFGTFWMLQMESYQKALFWARFIQCG